MRTFLPLIFALLLAIPVTAQTVVDVIVASDVHNTLEAAVIAAELDDDLSAEGPFTVFAPTDAAFAMLPDGVLDYLLMEENQDSLVSVLSYHVVPASGPSTALTDGMRLPTLIAGYSLFIRTRGDSVTVNGVLVTTADIIASNGIVHVIDAVLLQPAATVVDIVVASENHTTLEAAVVAAGLAGALSGDGPFTLFAPNDAAFAAVGEDMINALLADPTGDLATILQYHVVPGRFYSTDLMDGMMLTTLQGEMLEVTISGDTALVDGVAISVPDIMADNGVVHSIDGVLLPDAITSTQGEPAFAEEVSIAPNPATNLLIVQLPMNILSDATLTLRDLSGRTVLSQRATGERESLQISDLPAGTYLLEIRASAGTIQRKVLVQR